MASGAKFDDTVFQQRAAALARNLGKDEFEFVKQQTGLLAREVARHTPPYAAFPTGSGTSIGSKLDKAQGEWAIYNDLRRIFAVISDANAADAHAKSKGGPIYRNRGSGSEMVSPGVITTMSSMGEWHRRHRNNRGRTNWIPDNDVPWVGESLFIAYLKSQQKNVGRAKAPFSKASVELGAKGAVPLWVRNNMVGAYGSGKMTKVSSVTTGVIQGREKGLYHTIRHLPRLRKNRLIKAVKRGEYLMRQAAKDSGFNVV